jgi:hypothetical protein
MQIQSGSDFNGLFQALLRVHFCWVLPLLLEPRGGPALHPASEASIRYGELALPFSEGLRQPFVRQLRYYKDQAATCKREIEGRDIGRAEKGKGEKAGKTRNHSSRNGSLCLLYRPLASQKLWANLFAPLLPFRLGCPLEGALSYAGWPFLRWPQEFLLRPNHHWHLSLCNL